MMHVYEEIFNEMMKKEKCQWPGYIYIFNLHDKFPLYHWGSKQYFPVEGCKSGPNIKNYLLNK